MLLRSTRQNGTCRFPSSRHNFSEANFLDPGGSPRLRSGRLAHLPSRALVAPVSVSVAIAPRRTAVPYGAEWRSPPRRRDTDRCGVRWPRRGAGPLCRCTVSSPRPPGAVPAGARSGRTSAGARRTPHHTFSHMCSTRAFIVRAAGRWRDARADFGKHRPAASFPQEIRHRERKNLPIPGTPAPARMPASVPGHSLPEPARTGGMWVPPGTLMPPRTIRG